MGVSLLEHFINAAIFWGLVVVVVTLGYWGITFVLWLFDKVDEWKDVDYLGRR